MDTLDMFLEKLQQTPRTWRLALTVACDLVLRNARDQCPLQAVYGDMISAHEVVGRLTYHAVLNSADHDVSHHAFSHKLRQQLLDACSVSLEEESPEGHA
jgi:hypothetical protein